jgi:TRAP-type uncharacterized transport system substrate-binding protein
MTNVVINEKTYEIDEKNEDQVKIYNELVLNEGLQRQVDYELTLLKFRHEFLINALSDMISPEEEEGDGK